MFITPSFKKSLIVEQLQGNYLKSKFAYVSSNLWSVKIKPGLSFKPLARVTLAVGLPYLLVNRALGTIKVEKAAG